MRKPYRILKTLSFVAGIVPLACGGQDPQAQPLAAERAASLPSEATWRPEVEFGSNNNTWWLEVLVHDEMTSAVSATMRDGSRIALARTEWGSFAANEYIDRGTALRLVMTSSAGQSATTEEFRFLIDNSLEVEVPAEEEPIGLESPQVTDTYTVSAGGLLDTCGQRVLLRGVNKMHVWTDPEGDSLPEIAKTGANSVRIVWSTSGTPAALERLVQRARDNGLLPMVELHDATGNLAGVPALVDWWLRPDVLELIRKHERALLVNIANEAASWEVTDDAWVSTYSQAIRRMRSADIRAPLVIDTRGWGHDTDLIVSHGPELLDADPLRNIVFSTHLYRSAQEADAAYYEATFAGLAGSGLTVMIGEFGNSTVECNVPADYRALLAAAEAHQLSWYAWSWGPGNTPCAGLDMTRDGSFSTLHGWGLEVASTLPGSIKNTARPVPVSDTPACQ